MNVIINGLAALKPRTGVGHHVAQLVEHLRQVGPEHRFTVYPGEQFSQVIRKANQGAGSTAAGKTLPGNSWKGQLKELAKGIAKPASRWHFQAYTRLWKFDLYHEPNFVPYPSRLPTVITIHDLSVLKYPQWHPADRVKLHQSQLAEATRRASHIITVSEAVRREVCEQLNVHPDRVSCVYNGIGPGFGPRSPLEVDAARQKLDLPSRYFLCVGTIEPRKNLAMLMRAYAALPEDLRRDCPLILAGPWGWRADEERKTYEQLGAAAGVRQLGYVSDEDLPALYAGALALLYPSHYEGFGMPPTEMLACGGVVIASDIPVLREVCADRAHYVPPTDQAGWQAALHCLLNDVSFRERLSSQPFDRERYSWTTAAKSTLAIYQRVLGLTAP